MGKFHNPKTANMWQPDEKKGWKILMDRNLRTGVEVDGKFFSFVA
jgi:hypothetical protein